MIGDYQAIVGNTGGDNRVEFGTRLDHSIWYESPNWGGVNFSLLFSPGQNRASNSDNIATAESDCTAGDTPGDGGIIPQTCSDGSFGNAVGLGAGGRTVTTDCHDASDAAGGWVGSNPHCWTGGQLDGASLGMNWKF
jgi:hypothetical protein